LIIDDGRNPKTWNNTAFYIIINQSSFINDSFLLMIDDYMIDN